MERSGRSTQGRAKKYNPAFRLQYRVKNPPMRDRVDKGKDELQRIYSSTPVLLAVSVASRVRQIGIGLTCVPFAKCILIANRLLAPKLVTAIADGPVFAS